MKIGVVVTLIVILLCLPGVVTGCQDDMTALPALKTVPRGGTWGIYALDIETQDVRLIYDSHNEIFTSALRLSNQGEKFVFAQKVGGQSNNDTEIHVMGTDGKDLRRLTDNRYLDLYPVWSPDDRHIAFLSKRERDLDIYIMDAEGAHVRRLYDSGDNDADIDWAGRSIVFTSRFSIWRINDDGTQPLQITNPPDRGSWGRANLPAGDYDPRLSPDSSRVVFERLENTDNPFGGYNIFVINTDGTAETRLTDNEYSQGLVNWSHSGRELVYVVAAIEGQGVYDIYLMDYDGRNNRNITPDYFPDNFLCHAPVFSKDDAEIFFIGQWWEQE